MKIERITGCTRVCGESQGYLGLPLRDEIKIDEISGLEINEMTSAWKPSAEEIERLQNGASIHVSIFGLTPAPMRVAVSNIPNLN